MHFLCKEKNAVYLWQIFKEKTQNADALLSLSDFSRIKGKKNGFVCYLLRAVLLLSLCDVRDQSLWLHCDISERIKINKIGLKLEISLDEFVLFKNVESVYLNMFPCSSPTFWTAWGQAVWRYEGQSREILCRCLAELWFIPHLMPFMYPTTDQNSISNEDIVSCMTPPVLIPALQVWR